MTPLLQVRDLKVHFKVRGGFFSTKNVATVKAVDGVSLDLYPGEILGLVGESGCGKSSLGRALMRLIPATSGEVDMGGQNFFALKGSALQTARQSIQMIFQDPYASLNPRMTVYDILAEPLRVHRKQGNGALEKKVFGALERVSLSRKNAKKYPHEFSGGQRQRIAIARALILEPKVIIADEPVSSLDVSVQAQILNLLKDIQKDLGLSMVFISHNLAVVKYISDRIAVMYLGKIVETAPKKDLYQSPKHPYTQALVASVPIPDPRLERKRVHISVKGELPSPTNPPKGCAFHSRCPIAIERCKGEAPMIKSIKTQSDWKVSCFRVE